MYNKGERKEKIFASKAVKAEEKRERKREREREREKRAPARLLQSWRICCSSPVSPLLRDFCERRV